MDKVTCLRKKKVVILKHKEQKSSVSSVLMAAVEHVRSVLIDLNQGINKFVPIKCKNVSGHVFFPHSALEDTVFLLKHFVQ